jgi:hypothetical protein
MNGLIKSAQALFSLLEASPPLPCSPHRAAALSFKKGKKGTVLSL